MATRRLYYVYEHWRPDRDICFYVGKGKGNRAYRFNRESHYNHVVAKLSRLGMCVEVRLVGFELTETDAFDLEIKRIAFWRSVGIPLVNKTAGGEGCSGFRQSEEHRAKIGASRVGKKRSAEFCEKVSAGKRGKPGSRRGAKLTADHIAIMVAANKGRPLSTEHRAKLSAIGKGRPHTPEHRANISAALKARRLKVIA